MLRIDTFCHLINSILLLLGNSAISVSHADMVCMGISCIMSLNTFYWYQILAQDYVVVVRTQKIRLHGGFLIIAMYHHRETILSN